MDNEQKCNEKTCRYFKETGWPINDVDGRQWHVWLNDPKKKSVLCEAYPPKKRS
jgi:hypothetical protein